MAIIEAGTDLETVDNSCRYPVRVPASGKCIGVSNTVLPLSCLIALDSSSPVRTRPYRPRVAACLVLNLTRCPRPHLLANDIRRRNLPSGNGIATIYVGGTHLSRHGRSSVCPVLHTEQLQDFWGYRRLNKHCFLEA